MNPKKKRQSLNRRRRRVRKKVAGTAEKPRLAVYRSLRHMYAQVIDDDAGHTLVSASTLCPEVREKVSHGGDRAAAEAVGTLVAERAKEKNIGRVVFDRGGRKYQGRVRAVAEAARKAGLEF